MMRYSLDQQLPSPSVAQLQQFYEENKETYKISESVTFKQVFFLKGSPDIPASSDQFISFLENAPQDLSQLGDTYLTQARIVKSDHLTLNRTFGADFADRLFSTEALQWQGPIESKHGTHYVYLEEKNPARYSEFEMVEPFLKQEYEFKKRRQVQQDKIDEMRKNYKVVLPEGYDVSY